MDWLIVDSDFLAHRAFHSRGGLSFEDNPTGTIYGFLSDVINLSNKFMTTKIAFCFDSRHSKRAEIYPDYRKKRKEVVYTEEELKQRESFHKQRKLLRIEILPMIGWKNIFHQRGYEADDLIASVLWEPIWNATVVSADKDLYQLLWKKGLSLHNPITKRNYTAVDFRKEWNIEPEQWPLVKAAAGCVSDSIEGVKGIGEKTAAKWASEKLPEKSKKLETLHNSDNIIKRNLELVTLPFPGTKRCTLVEDKIDRNGWKEVCRKYGLKQLEGKL